MYVPAHVKQTVDLSLFYEKAPQDMSRYELQELERYMKESEENIEIDEGGNRLSKEDSLQESPEFLQNKEEIKKL